MIQFGQPFGFNGFHNFADSGQAPQNAASQTAGHVTVNNYVMAAPMAMPVAVMSPAYMMAYPQMAQAGAMGAFGAATGAPSGGHVTANPTNSMASSYGQGYGGGMSAMPMAMPMFMSPVFVQMGMPMVYGGYPQSQDAPAPAATPAGPAPLDVPDEVVPEVVLDPEQVSDGVPQVTTPVVDVAPIVSDDAAPDNLPTLPISRLEASDFARYRSVETLRSQETSLSLELRTKDGDLITLEFSQLDTAESFRFRGNTLEGQRMRDSGFSENSERLVNMDVVGELSDAERVAIDAVLDAVVSSVNSFFSGDMGGAVATLKNMEFDYSNLAELSLSMSSSRMVEVNKAYHNGDQAMHEMMNKDADVTKALEFMASEQKRLVDVAKSVLDDPSAARLVRELIPPLLAAPLDQLREKVDNADVQVLLEATGESIEMLDS
ncbi:MAG: hypothetical protein AAF513_06155 [Pseudomonadota bacterium]